MKSDTYVIPIINIFLYLYVSKYKGYGDNKDSSTQKQKAKRWQNAISFTYHTEPNKTV